MWPNTDLVTFTEEILNGKLQFLCSAWVVLIIPIYLLLKNLFLKKINHPALNLRVVSLVDLIFNNLFSHFLGLHDHKQTESTDLSSWFVHRDLDFVSFYVKHECHCSWQIPVWKFGNTIKL